MCGIFGYIGDKDCIRVLLDGLKRLEYRGYDSAGLAVIKDESLFTERCAGKIVNLENRVLGSNLKGDYGIGHTRWATHGRPTEENAHPHTDCKNNVVVVHNGIIENYLELKNELERKGHIFKTETDTEVIAHLLEEEGDNLFEALRRVCLKLKGVFAIAAISLRDKNKIVAASYQAPLVIGIGKNENFVSSDLTAILTHTRDVIYFQDGEIARIEKGAISFKNFEGREIEKNRVIVNWNPIEAEKKGFKHFMEKEIFEQPIALRDTLIGRISQLENDVNLDGLESLEENLKNCEGLHLIGCGTSYHASLCGKYMVEEIAGIPVYVDYASEFRYRSMAVKNGDLAIFISQSGETADTIGALKEAKKFGVKTIAICNVVGSMITREAHATFYTHAGPEIGVASTKAFTTQLLSLFLIALKIAKLKNKMDNERLEKIFKELLSLPRVVEKVLKINKYIKVIAKKYSKYNNFLYLGRGIHYPIALEGALKLKEISYIHAEGYAAGEMKHGPIALIDENMPVVILAIKDKHYEKVLSNLEEVKARDGKIIAICNEYDERLAKFSDELIVLDGLNDYLQPIINIIPLQLFAYHVALFRGCDVDQPRNLAKSVTVE